MYKETKFSPKAIFALKEALPVIFWKKEHLQDFLKLSMENNSIVGSLNWATKREAVKELIERMLSKQDVYKNDLATLLINTAEFNDFDNLSFWDNDGSKTKTAKEAVGKLKALSKNFVRISQEQEDIVKRRIEQEKKILQNKSLKSELILLKNRFNELLLSTNFQQRGFAFEKFLYDLFLLYELEPKGSFKIEGEQIDGAFTFQNNDYLMEAKWKKQVDRGDLANFCFKVENKFKTTIGLLITIDGVTPEAISPHFKSIIIMDGIDIINILDERISLPDLLFKKRRKATETGKIYANFNEL